MGDVFDAMSRAERERRDRKAADRSSESNASEATDGRGQGQETPWLVIQESHALSAASDEPTAVKNVDPSGPQVGSPPTVADHPPLGAEHLNGYAESVVVHHDRGSTVTEQYRAIRTQILARARNRRLQTHVITSSVPQEGKSVTTANLGVVFSELRNQKALLIEGDLRRPTFHKLFDNNEQPGLLQLLRGEVTDISTVVHPTVYENLQVVPAGGRDSTHCTQLLSSPRMAEILDRFRDVYDHIFIDSPPVVSVTDAAILGAISDQTLLVVRLHKTPVDMVDRAKRLLQANHCNVSGVILTHMKMMFLPGYMSRYSYGSSYTYT